MDVLYFCRHGQSEAGEQRRRAPDETPLTDNGRRQMRDTGQLLLSMGVVPDVIIASQLLRARQSAGVVADVLGYRGQIYQDHVLNERYAGVAAGMLHKDVERIYRSNFEVVPGAESGNRLQQRALQALNMLMAFKGTVLVAGHGTFGRALIRAIEGHPYSLERDKQQARFKNGQIARLIPTPVTML